MLDLPDGTRMHRLPEGTPTLYCSPCGRWFTGSYSEPWSEYPWPLIVLAGKPYCQTCYPKIVSILEADAKATEIRLIAEGEFSHPEQAKRLACQEAYRRLKEQK